MVLESDLPECEACDGKGEISARFAFDDAEGGSAECPECHGSGHMDPDEYERECKEAAAERWIDHCDMIGVSP